MSGPSRMLLVADRAVGEEIVRQLGDGQCVVRSDPYDALLEMGRRRWPVVVLSAPRGDFAGLCRAARRLQGDARLYAVCPPAGEGDARGLLGDPLDDYFIYPLSPQDVAELRRAGSLPPTAPASAGPEGRIAAASKQIAELIAAAQTLEALESHLADAVAALVRCPVTWVAADEAPAGVEPLLLAADDVPRVLVPRGAIRRSEPARAYLAAVRDCLPALLAAARRSERLRGLSITDHLTGAYNRRYFYERTDQIIAQAERQAFHVTLLLYDLDDFKRYNDTYGHAAGDEILRDTAALMKQITRSQDVVARIGGDEFAVLFWDPEPRKADSQPPTTAYALVDRFREAIRKHAFASLGREARGTLTISGGLARFPSDGRDVRGLLRSADKALRAAKAAGKNAVHLVGGGE
jgi:diguanylate cyclase (GGDEF)-like protein